MRIVRRAAVAVGLVLAAAGCGNGADTEVEADASAAAEKTPAAPRIGDADIAGIVVTANRIDVEMGELARTRATDERVKQFAQTMITDHSAVNQSAGELVTRLGVTPTENDVSRSLEASASESRESLMTTTGAEFDRAYVQHEIEYHRTVLSALDDVLIPNATNEELRETLVNVRPAFQAHLEHAESLLRSLAGS